MTAVNRCGLSGRNRFSFVCALRLAASDFCSPQTILASGGEDAAKAADIISGADTTISLAQAHNPLLPRLFIQPLIPL